MQLRDACMLGLMCALLAGCGVTIEKPELPKIVSAPPPNPLALTPQDVAALDRYTQAERAAAKLATANGQHRAAAGHWATVLALLPDDADAVQARAASVAAAQAAAQQFFNLAQQARARGDIAAAQRLALEALARDPDMADAPQTLRQWQRERNRATSRAAPKSTPRPDAGKAPTASAVMAENWEYVTLLAESGDIEGALQVLLPLASRPGAEPRLRRRSCELLTELARSREASNDRTTALASVERCLRLEPKDPEALRLQQQLKTDRR